jgi:hypothetical protein
MVGFKSTCPKWHFGQVGHGGKKTIRRVFFTKIPSQKVEISCNVLFFLKVSKLEMKDDDENITSFLELF